MKKKILIAVLILIASIGGIALWVVQSAQTSNPWNAGTIGEIPTPSGYSRVDVEKGSYGEYLRNLPLKKKGSKVHKFTGEEIKPQYESAGVIAQSILSNDEQCADVTMRLRGEYLWSKRRYSEICFRDVNGKNMKYDGGRSRKAFERYMRKVYGMCNTSSVYDETKTRKIKDVRPGDILVYKVKKGHKYGHAILVADVAKNKNGKVAILCIEGSTPAREKHVVRNMNPIHNPWYILDEDDDYIMILGYIFKKDELRHY